MNSRISTLILALTALLAGVSQAATTNIAQVPLLNISGTGSVKPNIMLLFDNSGSMARLYTPDHIGLSGNSKSCRVRDVSYGSYAACTNGMPPFNAPDFNRQYYNPAITYTPPVYYDGSSYPNMDSAATTTWTKVPTDKFGKDSINMLNNSESLTDLTRFPDKQWCKPNTTDCKTNDVTYTYPNNDYYSQSATTSAPYYYKINVVEYCTDVNMRSCKVVSVGAPAPDGYPIPAKVRWCNSSALTNCQAKYARGSYEYPRFGNTTNTYNSFGTITIGASSSSGSMSISSVSVRENGTTDVVITNGAVTAPSGTTVTSSQKALADALAQSIVAKTGLTNQYTACVRTPVNGATDCDSLGITLYADNVVAVVPLSCAAGAAKSTCQLVFDSSRENWTISAVTPSVQTAPAYPPTSIIKVSGSASNSKNAAPSISNMTANGSTAMWSSALSLAKGASAGTVATAIAGKALTSTAGNSYAVYAGGNAVSTACKVNTSNTVCVVDKRTGATAISLAMGSVTDGGSLGFSITNYPATAPVNDAIPVTTQPIAAGAPVFVRVDIRSGRTYPRDPNRTDCANASVCTYEEEMTNFANWYAYYKTRNQMMKTAVGLAFRPLDGNYRVGIVNLSDGGLLSPPASSFKVPKDFTGTNRSNWYSWLYAMDTGGGTPLRPALDNVGKMYKNIAPFNYAAGSEVVAYPCQQNFTFVTTDGYWNGGDVLDGTDSHGDPLPTNISQNIDKAANPALFCTLESGCVDPASQTERSLADIALYWYNGGSNTPGASLREGLEDRSSAVGAVPAGPGENTRLHMNTYTLGLGVDGVMNYEPNYDTAPKPGGDFSNLINRVASGCPWNNNGPYVWPDPDFSSTDANLGVPSRVDDLWHAAINGHGKYFSAADPTDVVAGLNAALNNIKIKQGAAAAAATSTPNISQQDNDIFSDTFTTVKWYGELTDKKIDTVTGIVGDSVLWSTTTTLGTKVAAATDSRVIKMRNASGGGLKDFSYDAMSTLEKSWFDNKCTLWSQCTILTPTEKTSANSGANLVNWLRGQQQYANDRVFRAYTTTSTENGDTIPIVLGDIASAKPAYLREPRKGYTTAGYSQFKVDKASRAATVFTAANDGMLHAFRASDGVELWAYVPRITMRKLYAQANTSYGTNHQFTVDGSPELGDVKIDGVWKTVLVAGLNAGGRGYYALDVTDPANPVSLWEICADPAVCASADERYKDIGLSFGNPQFGLWKDGAGVEHWVVMFASGYNNVPGVDGVSYGDGGAYLYVVDVKTGAILDRLAAGSASTTTPPGLAKITAITANPNTDPLITFVYGGDNQGRMWRFDFTRQPTTVTKMGDAGSAQPITTRPEVTQCQVDYKDADGNVTSSVAQKVVLFGTGRLLDVPDVANTDVQSVYALKDTDTTITGWRASSTMVEQTLTPTVTAGVSGPPWKISNNPVDLSTKAGWFVDLDQNTGERVNLDPKVVSGTLNVVTNIPSSSSACLVGGTSNVYALNVCTGSYLQSDQIAGNVLSNTSGAVGFIIVRLPSGALKMITTTADGKTITSGVTAANALPTRRVGWRRVRN
ncbi:hypothetical protein E4L96_13780 [Massilia arenosa]|uniref:PilY1 beta-propeller domain-containing protein n=1 Tax=Zemynaea arenosa TaxID=2561931 RepID=A0A4Y9SC46_9BURK|nr:PilC/PilY family type IV pilus protein [Massilia arenosa]TFW17866.1 hypothetical protein E4L96_13780 [Massilia arenosa]